MLDYKKRFNGTSMHILIVGKGHLGTFLVDHFVKSNIVTTQWPLKIEDLTSSLPKMAEELAGNCIDFVINAGGKTDLPWCEANPHEAFQANVIAPLMLARACRVVGARFIHLGSGCVWDGPYNPDGKPFVPTFPVTPACFYSWTKAACDAMLLTESSDDVWILRPRQVFSHAHSPRNTLFKLMGYKSLLDTPNSMTSAAIIATTIEHILAYGGPEIINVYNHGASTPYRIGQMLAAAGLREPPELLTKDQLDGFHKPKRVDTVLYDHWFEEHIVVPPVEDALQHDIDALAQASDIAYFKKKMLSPLRVPDTQ